MKAHITTRHDPCGLIYQEVEFCGPVINETVQKHIANVREKQFREALIRLGWTPTATDNRVTRHP